MNIRLIKSFSVFILVSTALLFAACGGSDKGGSSAKSTESKRAGVNEIYIHELGDPDKLNPFTSSNASASYIQSNIFSTLLGSDPVTYELYGSLAKSRPETELIESGKYKGGVSYTFEIRPEATWDNGTPITANDYIFSVKAVKNPKVDAASLRPYYDFIKEVKVDPNNNRKFTVIMDTRYILGEEFAGYWVYPEYIYDPQKLMRKFTIAQLSDKNQVKKLTTNPDIVKFANEFNSEKFQRDKGFVVGSGPYNFEEWKTGQFVTLKRKKNWWGNKVKDPNFTIPTTDEIHYTVIKDFTTAITAMKDEEIDLMRSIRAKDFVDLKKNKDFNKLYAMHTPDYMVYDYIGINMKKPKFKDKRVRQALNYLVDRQLIADVIMYGYGTPIVGPVHPSKSYYNKNLKPYNFDVQKAKDLMKDAGWKDSDNDGILDKVINGKKTPFKAVIFYNQGNTRRENIALMFKENARNVGMDIDVQVREFVVMSDLMKAHDYELAVSGWAGGTGLGDFKQIWHTDSYNGGSNYGGFGNAETDKLIEEIRTDLNEPTRTAKYKRFQEILYDEAPYVFLNAHKNKLAFHKRFNSANAYVPRPGYSENEWVLNSNFGKVVSGTAN